MARLSPAIGIDLGTCSSSVAVFQNGTLEVIPNQQGYPSTPSCVAFSDAGRLVVGDDAKIQMNKNPENTIYSAQRLIGRKFANYSVQKDMRYWPFEVINDGGKPKVSAVYKGERKSWFPEEISSMVLAKMKETAEAYLGKRVTDAVVTVPAAFDALQRQAILDAGTTAGLNVLQVISGSTAAAVTYGYCKRSNETSEKRNVLIFDLGSGTLDVTVVQTQGGGSFEVKSTAGDTRLGGDDFDNRVVDHFVEEFERRFKRDLRSSRRALSRLKTACEVAKRSLSSSSQAKVEINSWFEVTDFPGSITRTLFEELNGDLFLATLDPVEQALRDAKLNKSEIDKVILVGGSSRIPRIQQVLKDFFYGKELDIKLFHPDQAAAIGAAAQAGILVGDIPNFIERLSTKAA